MPNSWSQYRTGKTRIKTTINMLKSLEYPVTSFYSTNFSVIQLSKLKIMLIADHRLPPGFTLSNHFKGTPVRKFYLIHHFFHPTEVTSRPLEGPSYEISDKLKLSQFPKLCEILSEKISKKSKMKIRMLNWTWKSTFFGLKINIYLLIEIAVGD